jgi:hypothetical protein
MPTGLKRYYGRGHLHFITFICYRRLIQQGGVTIVAACPERSRRDGDGNRAAKTVAGVKTAYIFDDRNPTGYVQVLGGWATLIEGPIWVPDPLGWKGPGLELTSKT